VNRDDAFGYWLSGFVDGEGCFHARGHIRKSDNAKCLVVYFSVKLRADDRPILEAIRGTLGIGHIYEYGEKLSKHPQADYRVHHREELAGVIIPHFDRYPLRSKKGRDYQIWREIVLRYKCAPRRHTQVGIGSLPDEKWEEACYLSSLLREGRVFEIDPDVAESARERVRNTQPPLFVMQPDQEAMAI